MKKIIILAFGLVASGSIALERNGLLPSGMSILISFTCIVICWGTVAFYDHTQNLKKKIAVAPVKKETATVKENPALGMDVTKELAQKSVPRRGVFAS